MGKKRFRNRTPGSTSADARYIRAEASKSRLDGFAAAEWATAKDIIGEGRTPEKVLELAANAHGWGQYLIDTRPSPRPLACRAGCSWCCYTAVEVQAPEVFRIAEHIRSTYSADEQAGILERVREIDRRAQGKLAAARLTGHVPCPLLKGGRCSVYEHRPLACRGWTSDNARLCEASHYNPSITIHCDGWIFSAGFGVLQGLKQGLADVGLQSERLELTAALRVALELPDALERWIAGEPIFARAVWKDVDTGEAA